VIRRDYSGTLSLTNLVHHILGCDEMEEGYDGFIKRHDMDGYELVAKWTLRSDPRAMAAEPKRQMEAALECVEEIADRVATTRIRRLATEVQTKVGELANERDAHAKTKDQLAVVVAEEKKYRDFYEMHRGAKG
jgi:hypothetical protein